RPPPRPSGILHRRFTPTCVGTTPGCPSHLAAGRFTPTCVRTTLTLSARESAMAVHPHVRGDDPVLRQSTCSACGSPPRAWGRRIQMPSRGPLGRFTPTCVGTTGNRKLGLQHRPVHPHVRGDDHL